MPGTSFTQTAKASSSVGFFDELRVFAPLSLFPEIAPGDRIADHIASSFQGERELRDQDVIVVASKIVSKAENRYLSLDEIEPSERAVELSKITGKSAKVCQLVLAESQKVWTNGRALLSFHRLGYELSSAGIDRVDDNQVILLPEDPDLSARRIGEELNALLGKNIAVVVSDSHGRSDRAGAGAVALGIYGIDPLRLSIVETGNRAKQADETICDMFAAGAALIMGQRGRGIPVVCIRGARYDFNPSSTVRSILHHAKHLQT